MSNNPDTTGQAITYNGVEIGGSQSEQSWYPPQIEATVQLEYDPADRSVIRHRVSMTVSTIVASSDTTSQTNQMEFIRKRLSQPGAPMVIQGLGMGLPTIINDYAWGPKPRVLSIKPLCHIAHAITWQVEFAIYPCSIGTDAGTLWESFTFQTQWGIDDIGKSVRTISGQITIPTKAFGNGGGRPTADQVREALTVEVPYNFHRVSQTYSESTDRKTIAFSVVDVELRTEPFPPGVVQASGMSTLGSQGPGFAKGVSTLSMSLKMAPGAPRSLAVIYFLREVIGRQQRYRQLGGNRIAVIPQSMQVAHELWGLTSLFSFSWAVTGCLSDILLSSALYRPVQTTGYRQWAQSVEHTWKPRGIAGLQSDASEDAIISVCDGVSSAVIGRQPDSRVVESNINNLPSLLCEGLTEENSWLEYESVVRYKAEQPYSEHRSASDYYPEETDTASGSGYVSNWSASETEHEVEYEGLPSQRILLQWKGMRVKYKPEPPKLVSVGGKTARQVARYGAGPRVVSSTVDKCPIYFEAVSIEYVVTEPIGNVQPIEQKTICADTGEVNST